MNKCVFLDRDNTLIYDKGYTYRLSELSFLPNALEAVKLFKSNGYLAIVITNQSGVAKGLYTMRDVILFHNELNRQMYNHIGFAIDDFYICPHHKDGDRSPYNIDCGCRKPSPRLILTAAFENSIDLKQSFMFGDKRTDVIAGKRAGVLGSFLISDKYDLLYYARKILSNDICFEN